VQKDFLLSIRTLPKHELQSLTGDLSVEVFGSDELFGQGGDEWDRGG